MTQRPVRYYVVIKASHESRPAYFDKDERRADEWAAQYIAWHVYGQRMSDPPFSTRSRPSAQISSESEGPDAFDALQELVVALDVVGDDKRSSEEVVKDIIKAVQEKPDIFVDSSPDLVVASADHWCVADAADPIFSVRSAAERLLGIDFLMQQPRVSGEHVNVVIIDQGLNRLELGASYGAGWKVGNSNPGVASPPAGSIRPPHGMMIAQNILKIAPKALLFDLPLVASKISNIQSFLSFADAAFRKLLVDIATWRHGRFPGPWILVNPWGIYDRRSEHPRGHYTENPHNPLNKLVVRAVAQHIDVVFAAGNCGQFCPDNRCGGESTGPGRSIWGANSLKEVLTVGAVRADGMWLGFSSQGPGQRLLGGDKPDLCATSQFAEDDDAFMINTGTSAACGLTAGVLAALRSRWDAATVSPHQLKHVLNQTARKPVAGPWTHVLKHRFGHGVLDARAAFQTLDAQYP
jgi:Subtilase family